MHAVARMVYNIFCATLDRACARSIKPCFLEDEVCIEMFRVALNTKNQLVVFSSFWLGLESRSWIQAGGQGNLISIAARSQLQAKFQMQTGMTRILVVWVHFAELRILIR